MKTALKIFLLFITVFTLASCDKVPEDILENIPLIDMVGDPIITIEQGEDFTDPGASFNGNSDVEVTSSSNVNTNVIGSYTITYTLVFEGVTYTASRTVNVVPSVIADLNIEISNVLVTATYIEVTVTMQDTNSLLSDTFIVLYMDDEVIQSIAFDGDSSTIRITEFEPDTDYKVAIEGTYLFNGVTKELSGYEFDFTSVVSTPLLELYGLENMTLKQNETFIDPGAYIVNQFDLDISVDSDVDTSTPGYYTVTYSVISDSVVYGITRFVEVLAASSNISDFDFDLQALSATVSSISLSLEYSDDLGYLSNGKIALYEDEELVNSYTIINGINYITFSNLDKDTEYTVVVEGSYLESGVTKDVTGIELTVSTEGDPVPTLEVFQCTPNSFTIDCILGLEATGLSNVAPRVEVWVDGSYNSLFNATLNNSYIEITDLDAATEYVIKLYVDYTITATSEQKSYLLLDTVTVTTNESDLPAEPYVQNVVITPVFGSTNKVTVELDLVDPDSLLGSNQYFRFYYGSSQQVQALTVGHNSFEIEWYQIDTNRLFTAKVTAEYRYTEDDYRSLDVLYEELIAIPADISITSYMQEDMIFSGDKIFLVIEFDNADDVVLTYVKINGNIIPASDFVYPSNQDIIYVYMGVETDYTNFYYSLSEYGYIAADDSVFVVTIEEMEIDVRVHQVGDIYPDDAMVTVLELTTEDSTREISTSGSTYTTIEVNLDNKYNLPIESVSINGVTYTSFNEGSTPKKLLITVEISQSYNSFILTDITFTRSEQTVQGCTDYVQRLYIYGYLASNVVLIGTPEELNSIVPNVNAMYILTDDIDMSGIDFTPIGTFGNSFGSAFDGNGYTISNLTINSYEINQDTIAYIGLFGYAGAFITDVKLYNFNITVYTNETHHVYVGALAGYSTGFVSDVTVFNSSISIIGNDSGTIGGLVGFAGSNIRDCNANITISIDGLNHISDSSDVIVGGLVGLFYGDAVETSRSSGSITITNTNTVTYNVGGLIGVTGTLVSNSYSTMDISTTNTAYGTTGGLVGHISSEYATSYVINCYASGDIYAQRGYTGGLVGDSFTNFINSFAIGNIDIDGGFNNGFVGDYASIFVTNSFSYDMQEITYQDSDTRYPNDDDYGSLVTITSDEFDDSDFYTRRIGWNSYFYDFSNVDVSAKILPTLK